MVLPLSKGGNVLGFWLLISGGGCSLSPEWPKLGGNGGAHGTSPVKPIGKTGLRFESDPMSMRRSHQITSGMSLLLGYDKFKYDIYGQCSKALHNLGCK